uniref:Resolvase/invertase-type recombinase catalytic domain-containing protein n=1 Tax=Salmonella enterica subsp. enterica serovar London TaxID=149390 RepID=A0A3G8EVM1_SALET|nr:hypothetical protein KADIGFNM_00236 [Salmonella enterica subsp. enterica serovar London]AZF85740.1 hypothetical protein KADIGFNM_00403 [Salmonella enterica subsp. enterica serovar London]
MASIQAKGASLAVPGVVDLSDLAAEAQGVAKIVLEAVQIMLFRLALQMARDDYEDRRERQRQGIELARQAADTRPPADPKRRAQVVALRKSGYSINKPPSCRVQCGPGETIWPRSASRSEAARRVRETH